MGGAAWVSVRRKYDHVYPDYCPQAKSNPQAAYAYPDAALGGLASKERAPFRSQWL